MFLSKPRSVLFLFCVSVCACFRSFRGAFLGDIHKQWGEEVRRRLSLSRQEYVRWGVVVVAASAGVGGERKWKAPPLREEGGNGRRHHHHRTPEGRRKRRKEEKRRQLLLFGKRRRYGLGWAKHGRKSFLESLSLSPRIPSFPGVNVVVGVRVMHAEVEELLARSNNNVAGIKEKSQPCPPKLDYI